MSLNHNRARGQASQQAAKLTSLVLTARRDLRRDFDKAVSQAEDELFRSYLPEDGPGTFDLRAASGRVVAAFDGLASSAASFEDLLCRQQRDTLQLEGAVVLAHKAQQDGQRTLRVQMAQLRERSRDLEAQSEKLREVEERLRSDERQARGMQEACVELARGERRKSRWLWAVAPLTAGFSIPFAVHATHNKRLYQAIEGNYEKEEQDSKLKAEEAHHGQSVFIRQSAQLSDRLGVLGEAMGAMEAVGRDNDHLKLDIRLLCQKINLVKNQALQISREARTLQEKARMVDYADTTLEFQRLTGQVLDSASGSSIAMNLNKGLLA